MACCCNGRTRDQGQRSQGTTQPRRVSQDRRPDAGDAEVAARRSRVDEEYRGPVLFSNDAAATVITDLVEPNVLGKKPELGENARTTGKWSSSYKSRVLARFHQCV